MRIFAQMKAQMVDFDGRQYGTNRSLASVGNCSLSLRID